MALYEPNFPEISRHIAIGVDAVRKYMEHIGTPVIDVKTERFEQWNAMSHRPDYCFAFRFFAQCDSKEFKYFEKFSKINNVERHPRLNEVSLLETTSPLDAFSIFEYDEVTSFEFHLNVKDPQDIEQFIFMLKKETEGLLYDRFSEDFNEQLEDELGE